MLLRQADSSHAGRAGELRDEAAALADELGMAPLAARVAELSRSSAAPESYPDGLTEREAEVLRELARGQTNQRIADALFISQRTVATHLANIYTKTSCSNRAEAAAYAIQSGLVDN